MIDKKGVTIMNIFQSIEKAVVYISEAISRIFGPSDDMYPMTGVNPFEGDPYRGPNWAE
ncbi:isochorismate synthase [Okeania sp. KiyG1]|uniref:isochorismate synthase n=1 Tax=Okeania sp. KiyG1 TaxID=2720165 RepID=UPI0027DA3CB5|nr:isochorismate synthase [Okeania sp. KiyG1]